MRPPPRDSKPDDQRRTVALAAASDHPDNDPTAPEEDCFNVGADLVCPATGSATNRILSCVVEFESFGVDAALVINSELRDDPDVSACDVLHGAFDELF